MHERTAKLWALLLTAIVVGGFVYVGEAYLRTRDRILSEQRAETARLTARLPEDAEGPRLPETKYVPPAPVRYPFF